MSTEKFGSSQPTTFGGDVASESRGVKKFGRRALVLFAVLTASFAMFGAAQAYAADANGPGPSSADQDAPIGQGTDPCVDHDGDGWGWNGRDSCRMNDKGNQNQREVSGGLVFVPCVDSDGDGWGWAEYQGRGKSCQNGTAFFRID